MTRQLEEIESEILTLEPSARAALAKRLLDSLDDLSDEEIERLWAEEAVTRYEEFKAGKAKAIDGDDVFARARARK